MNTKSTVITIALAGLVVIGAVTGYVAAVSSVTDMPSCSAPAVTVAGQGF